MFPLLEFIGILLSLSAPCLLVTLASPAKGAMKLLMVAGAWPLVAIMQSAILVVQPDAGPAIFVANLIFLAAAFVVGRRKPGAESGDMKDLAGAALATCLVLVPLAFFWVSDSELRIFGWHNLMQLEAMYSVLENFRDDLGYLGSQLSYPFLGLLPLAAASRILDLSPTLLYPFFNIVTLFVWAGSVHVWLRMTRKDASQLQVASSIAIVMLFAGALVYLSDILLQQSGYHVYIESRTAPLIAKHRYIDAMTLGLMSLSLQYLCGLLDSGGRKGFRLLELYFGIQTCVSYPALGPVAVLFSGMMAARAAIPHFRKRPWSVLSGFASPIIVGASLILAMRVLEGDKVEHGLGVSFDAKGFMLGVINVGLTLGLTGFLACFTLRKRPVLDRTLCVLFVLSCSILFILLRLPANVQYKLLYGANILLLFHAAASLLAFGSGDSGRHVTQDWKIPAYAAVAIAFTIIQLIGHRPAMQGKPLVNESAYLIASALGNSINAVLENERIDKASVALVTNVDEPVIPFTLLSQYYYGGGIQIGYSMPPSYISTRIKGYSVDRHLERRHAIDTLLSTCQALPAEMSRNLEGRTLMFLLKQKNDCLASGSLAQGYKEHRLSETAFLYTVRPRP